MVRTNPPAPEEEQGLSAWRSSAAEVRSGVSASEEPNATRVPSLLELVGPARAGEPEAVEKLFLQVAPQARRICRGVLGAQHPDLDDAVQEGMVAVLRSLHAYREQGEFTYYAAKIVLRTAIRVRKRSQVRNRKLILLSPVQNESDGGAIAARTVAFERAELLRELLGGLRSTQAEALWLRIVLGYTMEEAAQVAGVPANTIKTRVRLGKSALHRRLCRNDRARALFFEEGG